MGKWDVVTKTNFGRTTDVNRSIVTGRTKTKIWTQRASTTSTEARDAGEDELPAISVASLYAQTLECSGPQPSFGCLSTTTATATLAVDAPIQISLSRKSIQSETIGTESASVDFTSIPSRQTCDTP